MNPPESGLLTVTYLEVLSSGHKLKVWEWSAYDMIQNVTQQQGEKRFCTSECKQRVGNSCRWNAGATKSNGLLFQPTDGAL